MSQNNSNSREDAEQVLLDKSRSIWEKAISCYGQPYETVLMLSGGNDSRSVFYAALELDINIDSVVHVDTKTGIPETTHWTEWFAGQVGLPFYKADAGDKYRRWVLERGFFGRGQSAHAMAFHLLKRDPLIHTLSTNIRKRKRDRTIFLLNGARILESDNRRKNMAGKPIRPDKKGSKNIWVNLVHDWSKASCRKLCNAHNAPKNPVADLLCRSAECFCGTAQSHKARDEAALFFPEWGANLDSLESEVRKKFSWGWGEDIPSSWKQEKAGQLNLFSYAQDSQTMCSTCLKAYGSDGQPQQEDLR